MKKSHVFILFAAILLCAAIPFLISAQADAVVGYAQVEKVRLNIEEPYGYREALFSGEILGSTSYGIWDFTGEDHGVNFYNGVSWYDETGKRSLTPGETFKTGRIYTLRVYFEIIASQTEFHSVKLANSVTVVQKIDRYLNGETVEDCYPTGKSIYRYAGLTRTFEACPAPPAEIRSVNIVDLDTPFDLADPDFSATAEGPNYIVDTIHSIQPFSYTNGICWVQQLGNGYTYSLDKGSDVFGRGKIYTVRILVQAEYPYRFLISSDKTKPDISAYIKGYRCEVEAANGYDPYYYAILKYTFPACPYGLTRIETANVKDVQIPKAGVTPDYEVTPDVGMTVLDDEGTVIKNGICWYDYTAGAFLKPTDTFIKGHEYSISMCLKTAEGYLFRDDEDGNCLTKASANGGLAQAECDMGSAPNQMYFEYKFPPAADPVPVKITQQPVSVTVANGQTAKVSLTATGDGLTYKWYYKNKGASSFSLTTSFKSNTYSVTMDSSRSGRQVYCVVTDKYGNTAKSNTVTLSMSGSVVTITKQPVSVTVASGQTAKVSLTATGDGLSYKWYFKNKGASSFSLTNSFKSNTYSVTMDSSRSGRQVYCVVTDKYGNTAKSNTVTLSMSGSVVTITKQPVSVTVANGQTAKVSLTAAGEGLTYQWYIKNSGKTSFAKSSVTTNTYSVTMKDTVNGRQAYCVVTDKYGNTAKTNTVTLSMSGGVKITKQPVSVTVANGQTAKVSLTATGDGLTYKWYYKNKGASSFSLTNSFKSNTYSVTMDSSRSGRQVYCVVTDKYGNTAKTNTVTLTMAAAPKITQQPVSVTVANGQTAKITFTASGEGLTYKWYFKNKGASAFSVTNSFKSNTYSVTMDSSRNGRQVYCVVTDQYGQSVKTNTVTLKMK